MRRAQAPGYSKVISRPMDFMTMHARFEAGAYGNWDALRADLDTMFSNAMTFNAPATVYHKQARSRPPALFFTGTECALRADLDTMFSQRHDLQRARHRLPQAGALPPPALFHRDRVCAARRPGHHVLQRHDLQHARHRLPQAGVLPPLALYSIGTERRPGHHVLQRRDLQRARLRLPQAGALPRPLAIFFTGTGCALRANPDTMFSDAMTFNAPATVYHKQARSPWRSFTGLNCGASPVH